MVQFVCILCIDTDTDSVEKESCKGVADIHAFDQGILLTTL